MVHLPHVNDPILSPFLRPAYHAVASGSILDLHRMEEVLEDCDTCQQLNYQVIPWDLQMLFPEWMRIRHVLPLFETEMNTAECNIYQ